MGARLESTAYGGFDYPTDERRAGVHPPRFYGALVTGYASRTIDAWVGGLYRRYVTPSGETADHPGDLAMYSVVFGYRLAPFRKGPPYFSCVAKMRPVGRPAFILEGAPFRRPFTCA